VKRSPGEKKALDYKKQRRGFSEYSKALRGGKWRRNKRRPAQQSLRQAERRAVSGHSIDQLADPGFDPGAIRRPSVRKWGAKSLGEWVPQQLARRKKRAR
jgi:hypothetical protein